MFKTDIDGLLAWVTQERGPALVIEEERDWNHIYYWVKLIGTNGNMVTQTRYDTAKQALRAYAELLPEDE